MEATTEATGKNGDPPRAPLAGILVAVASTALMVLVSWAAWPDLPETVHGGKVNLDGTPHMVPRALLVLALPLSTGFLTAVLAAGMVLGHRLQEALGLPGVPTARSTTRGANVLLCLLAPFLLVTHGVLVLGQAGWDLPVLQAMGAATGLFLAGIGAALPRPEPRDGHDHPLVRWWTAAHQPLRAALVLVGLVQAAVALAVDHPLVFLTSVLLAPAMGAAVLWPVLRGRV